MASLVVALAAILGLAPSVVWADPASDALAAYARDQTLTNVVRISVAGGRGGAGFIVGRSGDALWVATAAHVVFPNVSDAGVLTPKAATGIEVFTRGRTAAWPLAGAPQWGGGDIAFLPVAVPIATIRVDAWRERVLELDPTPGASVELASTASTIAFAPPTGRVRVTSGAIAVDDLVGQAGQSGAPVFSGRGLIGMYVSSFGDRIVPMPQIEAAARRGGVAWNLLAYPPRPIPVRVCLTVRGADRSVVRLNGEAGMIGPGPDGCADVLSGPNLVAVSEMFIACTPGELVLPRTAHQALAIDCAIDPTGPWMASTLYVQVQRLGETRWRLEGAPSAMGALDLTLTRVGPALQVAGASGNQALVTGFADLRPRALTLNLIVGGTPVRMELTR